MIRTQCFSVTRIVLVKINGYGERHMPFSGVGLFKERLENLTPDKRNFKK